MELTKEQLELYRSTECPEANDLELKLFGEHCKAKDLDPFAGHIVLQIRIWTNKRTGRKERKASIMTTIEGARLIAERTGEYAGSDEPEYDSMDNQQPQWCRVKVRRIVRGHVIETVAKLLFREFSQGTATWKSMPYHMIGKVTEMAALRKAFPNTLGGIHEENEVLVFEDAPEPEEPEPPRQLEAPSNMMRWKKACAALSVYGFTEPDLMQRVGDKPVDDLTDEDFDELKQWHILCQKANTGEQANG